MNPSKSQPFVSLLVALASIFIISWGLKSSAAILNPILLAAVITIVVLPMPQSFTKRGLPDRLSFVLTLLIVVGGLAAVVLLIAYSTLGLQSAIIVFIGYVLINGSVQNIIQPRMMGQGLGISTLVVFISLFVWGWLFWGVGAILSVPLTMIIMAVLNNFDSTRWIAVLMSAPKDEKSDDHTDALHKLQAV